MGKRTKFLMLKRIIDRLHGPEGCPWDKSQTYKSLVPHFKEEAGELIRAVRRNDFSNMQEELGDLLLFVMFYSKIAEKDMRFNVEDVIEAISSKLVRRHPHVFANLKVRSKRDILRNWKRIKREEKKR